MPPLFDTTGIPDRPEYWDDLAARVARAATEPPSAIEWIGRPAAATLWAASLVAAAAIALAIALPASEKRPATDIWRIALAPSDDVGRLMGGSGTPPPLGVMVFAVAPAAIATDNAARRAP